MSNYSRFLNIWLEFDNAYRQVNGSQRLRNVDELANLLLWLKRWGNIDFSALKGKNAKEATLKLYTTVEGKCAPCEVKLYRGREGGFAFIRKLTGEDGSIAFRIPQGEWNIKITHGPEIEAYCGVIKAMAGETVEKRVNLARIVDMREMGWYNGELHHHSIYSSPVYGGTDDVVDDTARVSLSMRAASCDFGALSDHHNIFNHSDWKKQASDGFIPIISKEISTSNGHIMSMGVEKDVIYDIPYGEKRTSQVLKDEFVNISGQIRGLGGVAQINHPISESASVSWSVQFNDIMSKYDSLEIWNGAHPMIKNSLNHKSFELWLEVLGRGTRITATAGSDTHYTAVDQYEEAKEQIASIMAFLEENRDSIPEPLQGKVRILTDMWETSYPLLNKWIIESLGTAGVRNYFHLEGEPNAEAVLDAVRKGRGFVTNGPLLLASIGSGGYGEMRGADGNNIDVEIRMWSRQPVEALSFFLSDGRVITSQVSKSDYKGYYFTAVKTIEVKDAKWIVCSTYSDFTNLAIANPIYL